MKPDEIDQLHNVCKTISQLKKQLIEKLPHFGSEALFIQNDEITTGQLDNKVEIKIHLIANKLLYFHDEEGHSIDLSEDGTHEKLQKILVKYNLKMPDTKIDKVSQEQLSLFRDYAIPANHILELFRMKLEGNFTLVHLWPDHFDFSVEWFTGKDDQR